MLDAVRGAMRWDQGVPAPSICNVTNLQEQRSAILQDRALSEHAHSMIEVGRALAHETFVLVGVELRDQELLVQFFCRQKKPTTKNSTTVAVLNHYEVNIHLDIEVNITSLSKY